MAIPVVDTNPFMTLLALGDHSSHNQVIHGNPHLIIAYTVNEAFYDISKRHFDLIIIDCDLDSEGLLRIIKAPGIINRDTPIIALVENTSQQKRKALIAAGFDDYIAKPLTSNKLAETIGLWQKNNSLMPFYNAVNTFLANCQNNRNLALDIYNKLFASLESHIAQIGIALKAGEYKFGSDKTHEINGHLRTCYLFELASTANDLEKSLMKQEYDYADGYFLILQRKAKEFIAYRQAIVELIQGETTAFRQ